MINLITFADTCTKPNFLGFPTWYQYLQMDGCSPKITGLNDIWLIVAALISILLRLAAIVAVFMVVYGGFQFMTSQGNPDATAKARTTILNALIGMIISITAAAAVQFIASRFN